jgi:hypothetical protein
MRVTVSHLKQTLGTLYTNLIYKEDSKEECLFFDLKCGNYFAYATLKIFECETAPMQAIGFSLVFTDTEGEQLDFRKKDFSEVTRVCASLQQHLDWGILSPCITRDKAVEAVEAVLYRTFHTSPADLAAAQKNDYSSELLTALINLTSELEYIAAVLQHYAVTEDFDPDLVELMLRPTEQVCS